ncbi:MAG TPA: hypothetical protein DIW54_13025 [Chitinophagaceae bacterium]|nr:hypothetical protein [Chitinophagaceae bacterium]
MRTIIHLLILLLLISCKSSLAQKHNNNYKNPREKSLLKGDYFSENWNSTKKYFNLEKIFFAENLITKIILTDPTLDLRKGYKLYSIKNFRISDIASVKFEQAYILVKPSNTYNKSVLYFTKQADDYINSDSLYLKIKSYLRSKYGKSTNYTSPKKDALIETTFSDTTIYPTPIDESSCNLHVWNDKQTRINLSYYKDIQYLLLSIENKNQNTINWYNESEYEENFTSEFKQFDENNGYKKLKFGMTLTAVKSIVKYQNNDLFKNYKIENNDYKFWFDRRFDDCYLRFNKKGLLFQTSLQKTNQTDEEYEIFLNECKEMFGRPMVTFEKKYTYNYWIGKNISIYLSRWNDGETYVIIKNNSLDDSQASDKLY